ncbi:TylF/MycF/NovP-related O-methyltransferase [Aquabacterium commune]|uniref:TylF/MycF/NovP-related O-methyltransferase n=1 Tax=Aquabacterium commune TaxID=70586 RepID=UPI003BB13D1D
MIQPGRLTENIAFMLELARGGQLPPGAVVECGVWKGGMALACARVFGPARQYRFFDSFEGLPPPDEYDGMDAHYWAAHPEHPRYFDNCRANLKDTEALLANLRPHYQNVQLIRGWFGQSLPTSNVGHVAFLHLDCDWYRSTYTCLDHFWPLLRPGSVILIDDYYDWEGCRRAVHDFMSRQRAREAIRSLGAHGGAIITRLGNWTLSESPHLR